MVSIMKTAKTIAPNAIDKSLEKLADKPARFLGDVIAAKLRICFSNVIYKAKMVDYENKVKYHKWMEETNKRLDYIPPENRCDPPLQIAEPLGNNLAACIDETELSEMFSYLLKSACDREKLTYVHPSFPDIIRQLSPLDAQILSTFKDDPRQALADYRNQNEDGSGINIKTNVFYVNDDSYDNIDLNTSSITNLIRLGLLNRLEAGFIDENEYQMFKNDQWIQITRAVLKSEIKEFPYKEIVINHKIIEITSFGTDFINACYE